MEEITKEESSANCVNRVALINKLEILDKRYGSDFYWEVRKIVDNLPPVTPIQKWNTTPPTEDTYDILLSAETEASGSHVWAGLYENGHYYYVNGIFNVDDEVIAWMPLPKPYKEESEV